MSDRSRIFLGALITVCLLAACGPGSEEEQFREFVEQVLEQRYIKQDYDRYMQNVDHSTEMDSARMEMVMMMHRQFADFQRQVHGGVESVRMINVTKDADSIRYVHYEIMYADSTRETAMMKVIRKPEGWIVRSRN